jgi:hypothetical protein
MLKGYITEVTFNRTYDTDIFEAFIVNNLLSFCNLYP